MGGMLVFDEVAQRIGQAEDLRALDEVRVALLGKNGEITQQLKQLGQATPEERQTLGKALNELRRATEEAIASRKSALEAQEEAAKLASERVDVTLPPRPREQGLLHPITQVMDEITGILGSMGFAVRTGPLIEDDEHNFGALNIPKSHPARQMHDTFYVESGTGNQESEKEKNSEFPIPDSRFLLRTHTSPVQIRTMRSEQPPIKIIAPGSTFRCDSDLTHTPMFHQVEGLLIDKDIHMGHLKGCVSQFLREFFGVPELKVRFRPSFFPFTEPSAEVDIGCKRGKDSITIGEGEDWLEVMGCGMVHANVLKNCGIDPDEWQGFAFGMGVERLAMLKYNIPDLRTFFESDVRWLNYYGFGVA